MLLRAAILMVNLAVDAFGGSAGQLLWPAFSPERVSSSLLRIPFDAPVSALPWLPRPNHTAGGERQSMQHNLAATFSGA